jgi:hypothetical protein
MEKEQNLIGLSLSGCMKDMVEGKVDPDRVKMIVSGTNWKFPEMVIECVERYCEGKNVRYTLKFKQLLDEFLENGKIIQPRNYGMEAMNIANGYWAVQCWNEFIPEGVLDYKKEN